MFKIEQWLRTIYATFQWHSQILIVSCEVFPGKTALSNRESYEVPHQEINNVLAFLRPTL